MVLIPDKRSRTIQRGREPGARRTMELGRVNLGTHARVGWVICIPWTRFLGGLTQHPFHTALCLYSASTWQGGVELVFDAEWTKLELFPLWRRNQYGLWWDLVCSNKSYKFKIKDTACLASCSWCHTLSVVWWIWTSWAKWRNWSISV